MHNGISVACVQAAALAPALSAVKPLLCFLDLYLRVQEDREQEEKNVTRVFGPILFKQAIEQGEDTVFPFYMHADVLSITLFMVAQGLKWER